MATTMLLAIMVISRILELEVAQSIPLLLYPWNCLRNKLEGIPSDFPLFLFALNGSIKHSCFAVS